MPRIVRVRSMASFSRALPGLERWERPTSAFLRASGVQPGCLAHGPDEKKGRAGRTAGLVTSDMAVHSFQNDSTPLGERGPLRYWAMAAFPSTWNTGSGSRV